MKWAGVERERVKERSQMIHEKKMMMEYIYKYVKKATLKICITFKTARYKH